MVLSEKLMVFINMKSLKDRGRNTGIAVKVYKSAKREEVCGDKKGPHGR